jgi:hypothetical protein
LIILFLSRNNSLISLRRNDVPLKDFIDEARGVLDIQHYLIEADIKSSLAASSLEDAALALVPEEVDDLAPADLLKDVLYSPNGEVASCQVVSQNVSKPKIQIGKLAEPIDGELKLVLLVINPLKKKVLEVKKYYQKINTFG